MKNNKQRLSACLGQVLVTLYPHIMEEKKRIQLLGPMSFKGTINPKMKTIVIDGGLNHGITLHDYITIGDNDSNDTNTPMDHLLSKFKDVSDFRSALNLIDSNDNYDEIITFGLLGKRKDHEFANFLESYDYLQDRRNTRLSFDHEIFVLSPGKHDLTAKGHFSIFSFHEAIVTTYMKCDYELKDEKVRPLSSHGLSNIAQEDISLEISHSPVLLFLNKSDMI
jgi:thiamine pyrophosphokinase